MSKSPPLLLHSLLDEPILGIEDDGGHRAKTTLPGLLARLPQGTPTTLTADRRTSSTPVHAFLVQLAAIALTRGGLSDIAHDEGTWRELLLGAANHDGSGAEAFFSRLSANLRKPVFLQPPIQEGNLEALKNEHSRPSRS